MCILDIFFWLVLKKPLIYLMNALFIKSLLSIITSKIDLNLEMDQ